MLLFVPFLPIRNNDENYNFKCDTDELSAVTDANGKASITVPVGGSWNFGAIVEIVKDVTVLTYDGSKAAESMVFASSHFAYPHVTAGGEKADLNVAISATSAYVKEYYFNTALSDADYSGTTDWNTFAFSGTPAEVQAHVDEGIYLSKEAYQMEIELARGLDASGVVWDATNTFERYESKSMMLREVAFVGLLSPSTYMMQYDSSKSEGDNVSTALSLMNFGDISDDVIALEIMRVNGTFLPSLQFPSR